MNIAVLMTCHNRRETTMRCLESLVGQCGDDRVVAFVVDDGSNDGTTEAVQGFADCAAARTSSFTVRLISGSGSLYWAKGMSVAWKAALEFESTSRASTSIGDFDCFLWLNDDGELRPDALRSLRDTVKEYPGAVIVGEIENSRGEIVYGKRGDLFTGNFVGVPRSVYEKLGMICGEYSHAWADSDYAMRCKKNGVRVVSCGVVGKCEGHPNRPSLAGMALKQRWHSLFEPKGWCLHDLWLYRKRNWGILVAVASSLHLIVHVLFGERK